MRKILLAIFVIFVCSLISFSQSVITDEEYAVYGKILRNIRLLDLEQNKVGYSFVILEDTFKPQFTGDYKTNKFGNLTQNFKRNNQTISKLEKLFPVKYEYEIISQSEIDELLKIGRNEFERVKAEYKLRNIGITGGNEIVWHTFHAKHPKAKGYYQFSKVGFSSDKKFALVSVEGKGAYWSSTMEYILKKVKGKWTFYQSGGGFSIE